MPGVCIVYDRLRAEEKMLQKEASDLGCEVRMLDAKAVRVGTESTAGGLGLEDSVALERCVSYFRGLHFTACLEFLDVPVLNRLEVAAACGNKMLMTLRLKKAGVPTPRTHFAFTAEAAAAVPEREGYPVVIKPVIGSWGRGVMPVADRDAMEAIAEVRAVTDGPHDRIYYLQEKVDRPPRDIRVITVGDEPVAAMYRRSSGGFKTNIALGAEPELCEISGEMADLASRASKAVGGGILGVDMMEDRARGLVVHEVNNTVEFKGLARVSRRNIPGEIVGFALGQARK